MRRRLYRRRRQGGGIGCLPAVAFAFAAGVILALTCSYSLVVVLLSIFLIVVILSACC